MATQPKSRGMLGWNKPGLPARRIFARWGNSAEKADEAWTLAAAGTPVLFSFGPPEVVGAWSRVASGADDIALRSLFQTLPPCKCAFHHEPEDNATAGSPAHFRAAFDHVAALMPPWIEPVVVLMGWTFEEASGRDPRDWIPESAQELAVDAYNWFGTGAARPWRWPSQIMAPVLAYAPEAVVWETNSREDYSNPGRKAEWIRAWGVLCEAQGIAQLTFFDGGSNNFTLLSSPQTKAAVERIATSEYFGGEA